MISVESLAVITSHSALKLTDSFGSPIIHRSFNPDFEGFWEGKGNYVVYISTAVKLEEKT